MGSGLTSAHAEGLTERLKFRNILAGKLGSDFFEAPDGFGRIELFSAVQADFRGHFQHGGVLTPAQELLDLLLSELASAKWTPLVAAHSVPFSQTLV